VKHPDRVDFHLDQMAEAIRRAIKYTDELGSLQALEHDHKAQDAIVRNLTIIGEAAKRIEKLKPDFIAAHPEVPWADMQGIRNKVVHDYFDISWKIVWNTIKQDLPAVRQMVEKAVVDARKK
jgi:uncharacterized protein with HEPN domain